MVLFVSFVGADIAAHAQPGLKGLAKELHEAAGALLGGSKAAAAVDGAHAPGTHPPPPTKVTIGCHTVASEVKFRNGLAQVVCPPHCEREAQGAAIGASLHPMESTVCEAAIVDGVLPVSGGELLLHQVPHAAAPPAFDGKDVGVAASVGATDQHGYAWHAYALDTADQQRADVRLIDAAGAVGSHGLLQVRTTSGFGTVCGANAQAAEVVCKEMGFSHGAVSRAGCANDNGANVCGAKGSPVAMQGLSCLGGERDLQETTCRWKGPTDPRCLDHEKDTVISCWNSEQRRDIPDGKLRLVDEKGNPSKDGVGRLEWYRNDASSMDPHWTPVCGEGFTEGDALTACRQLGYESAEVGSTLEDCTKFHGRNLCSKAPAEVLNVQCAGQEKALSDCAHEVADGDDDADACHSKLSAVVKCTGGGDASGGLEEAPAPQMKAPVFLPKKELRCADSLDSIGFSQAPAGSTFVVHCRKDCRDHELAGSAIFTPASSICQAAVHAGVTSADGGDVVVTVGHGQSGYYGSRSHAMTSADAPASQRSLLVSPPTADVLSRVALHPEGGQRYAGNSTFGDAVVPKWYDPTQDLIATYPFERVVRTAEFL